MIWYKPNAHPESVRDRPTKAHETVFLLSKSQDYFYDVAAVKGPNGRRLRTMWDINTEPRRRESGGIDDHPAVMPMPSPDDVSGSLVALAMWYLILTPGLVPRCWQLRNSAGTGSASS